MGDGRGVVRFLGVIFYLDETRRRGKREGAVA